MATKKPKVTEKSVVMGTLPVDNIKFPGGYESVYDDHPIADKPALEDTPYRSMVWVSSRLSADGNDYKPGDPIPLAEAIRQEQVPEDAILKLEDEEEVVPQARVSPVVDKVRVTNEDWGLRVGDCAKCKGTGKRAYRKTHKPDCKCVSCLPCKMCDGTGTVSE